MFEDYMKDFPFGKTNKKYQKKIIKFYRDCFNKFVEFFKWDDK